MIKKFLFILALLEIAKCTACDDGATCPGNQKCCATKDGMNCCPYVNGVCCSDMKHCCPSGYKCTVKGSCLINNKNNNKDKDNDENLIELLMAPIEF